MQRFKVSTRHLEICDTMISGEFLIKQPRRVFHKLDMRAVQLGKGLFVLAFDPVSYTHLTLPTICSV